MTLTAFVKISTVLQIVRGAIGAQNVPSNVIVMALAGALTLLAMAPLGSRVTARAEPILATAEERSTTVWVVQLWKQCASRCAASAERTPARANAVGSSTQRARRGRQRTATASAG